MTLLCTSAFSAHIQWISHQYQFPEYLFLGLRYQDPETCNTPLLKKCCLAIRISLHCLDISLIQASKQPIYSRILQNILGRRYLTNWAWAIIASQGTIPIWWSEELILTNCLFTKFSRICNGARAIFLQNRHHAVNDRYINDVVYS